MPALDQVAWYGLGPHETYPDSRAAGRLGRYRATVDELATPYVVPRRTAIAVMCGGAGSPTTIAGY